MSSFSATLSGSRLALGQASVPRANNSRRSLSVASVKKGEKAPDFSLVNEAGKKVKLSALKKPTVVYFYPKDDSPACTKEAVAFADSYAAFTKAGAAVVGISSDSPESHKAFKAKYNLPFQLLTDEGGDTRKQYGIKGDFFGALAGRETYVIDKQGVVQMVFNNQFAPEKHITEALETIKDLKGGKGGSSFELPKFELPGNPFSK